MKKAAKGAILTGVLALCGVEARGGAFVSDFNNNNGFFNNANFLFRGEKGMDVDYNGRWFSRGGGVVRLRTGRRIGNGAFGVWFQTADLFPSGAFCVSRCRVEGNSFYNWSAFWTLYDQARETSNNWQYYELDVLETYPQGNFFNRYTFKNPNTNEVQIQPGELNAFNGRRYQDWRKSWRNYSVNWGDTSATFNVDGGGGQQFVASGAQRSGFRQRMILQNRPWGPDIGKLRQWWDIGTLVSDSAAGYTP